MIAWLDRTFYPTFQNNWDDLLFRDEILSVIQPSHHVLDLGAGAGIVAQMDFRGRVARVCGLDPDPRVESNSYLDEGKVGVGESIPYPNSTFDIVFADNVLEHLDRPAQVFSEIHRVMKPGGLFLAKTPNRWHYMPVIARLTPHVFHQFVNRLRGRASGDTFPTRYQVNSPGAVGRCAASAGFEVERIRLYEGRPEYLRMTSMTYLIGLLYERLVNAIPAFSRFRILLIARLRKPA
jgi:SAM-dependent methyltransferase